MLGGAGREGVETLDELEEGDVTILVAVKDGDDSADEGVVCEL